MRFFTLAIFFLLSSSLFSQASLEVAVTGGNGTTTCTDFFSGPDVFFQVNVNNQGWETYPRQGNCFNEFGTVQYSTGSYNCPIDVPDSIEICIKIFENDGLFGCTLVEDCAVEICDTIEIIPAQYAQPHRIEIPAGGASEGYVEVEINFTGAFTGASNDHICGAIDLGILDFGSVVGDADAGGYDNICAEEGGDIQLKDFHPDGWYLHKGVWFSFETGSNPSGAIFLNMLNDPQNTGDSIGLQGAFLTSDTDDCMGRMTIEAVDWTFESHDDTVRFHCPEPNTKYYMLIDGIWLDELKDGVFGLEVVDLGVEEVGDLLCEHISLGAVPPGGSVESGLMSNFCLTNTGDPRTTRFVPDKTVWLSFEAPATGHVLIEGISQKTWEPIDLEMAVFESDDNTCTGQMSEIAAVSDLNSRDETIELSCLTPGQTYFLMVDGSFRDRVGYFEVKVTELFDDTPITNQSPILCAGESIIVGRSLYDVSGTYVDTILLGGGCDSVVYTDLTVLDSLKISVEQILRANDFGNASGAAAVLASGGSGKFDYNWSDGQTAPVAVNLRGGENYCVTVTDQDGGCEEIICLYIEYITPIIPSFSSSDVRCFGESNGAMSFSVNNGEPPYNYQWSGQSFTGNGQLADDEQVQLSNLPAGFYEITVSDLFFDTVFTVEVVQPEILEISLDQLADASCYGYCDGTVALSGKGGVGNYAFNWASGSKLSDLSALCAGIYEVSLTDGNGCETSTFIPILQPDEFIAEGVEEQGVTCLGWTDGIGSITTNGNPTAYEWETGDNTISADNLGAGGYLVTVTNSDGCFDTTTVTITEPEDPFLVDISVETPIRCKGEENASLMSNPRGGTTVDYKWNTNESSVGISGVGTGWYFVTVTSETQCEAVDSFFLSEPEEIFATAEGNQLTCLDPEDGGVVTVLSTAGGVSPYEYSVDGTNFTDEQSIGDLFPGNYDLIVRDDLGCEREFPFTVLLPPDIEVILPGDTIVELGDIIRLEALTNNPRAIFEWSNPDLPCITPDCKTLEFQPIRSENLQITVTDSAFFCMASAEMTIQVLKNYNVFIPSAFSPNNDGINDRLNLFGGTDVARIKNFKVFDRYGSSIYSQSDFSANDTSIGWDGSGNGKQLDPGVYVFFAEIEFIDGEVEIFKGDVTVVR